MTDETFDYIADKREALLDRTARIFETARAKQRAGDFTLVDEWIAEPYQGYHFDVAKGQSFRFELLEGNQILDIMFLNQHNWDEEYSQFISAGTQGPAPREGYTIMSCAPYARGMATVIRDTVSYERLDEKLGAGGRHMFGYNVSRCDEAQHELTTGVLNVASCKSNILDALNRLGGEELMRAHKETQCVCIFQPTRWQLVDGAPLMTYHESHDIFRPGDYVEMIAEQHLTVVFSMCPLGGQTNLVDPSQNICWPLAVKTFDTGLDFDEVEILKSREAIEFVKQGRPGVAEFRRGEPGGEGSFAWEASRRGEG